MSRGSSLRLDEWVSVGLGEASMRGVALDLVAEEFSSFLELGWLPVSLFSGSTAGVRRRVRCHLTRALGRYAFDNSRWLQVEVGSAVRALGR